LAVYKRTYSAYEGSLTPAWSRFLILPRYSFARLWQSKFLVMFFMACFFYPLGCVGYIYLANNLSVLSSFGIPEPLGQALKVQPSLFLYFCWVQAAFTYLLTAFIGPSLISPDLVNGAMPLYLCRPFSRAEYIAGKMSVLVFLLSLVTWVPGLVLFAIQASLAGWEWTKGNLWIAGSLFIGLMIWILLLSLLALALSAWIKWKIAAGGLVLGVFFAGAGFGTALNSVMRTNYGTLLNLTEVMFTIWSRLFSWPSDTGISVEASWICVGVVCATCLWLLIRRVRAFEVVK
jgi:ABC-2 type transport system permease protein